MDIGGLHCVQDVLKGNVERQVDKFLTSQINVKAGADFRYLCNNSNLSTKTNMHFTEVSKVNKIGDYLCIGAQLKEGQVKFSRDYLKTDQPDNNVAVVIYNNDEVDNVLVFPTTEIISKAGLFSIFGYDKKTNMSTIKFSKAGKMEKYQFGVVFSNYIN